MTQNRVSLQWKSTELLSRLSRPSGWLRWCPDPSSCDVSSERYCPEDLSGTELIREELKCCQGIILGPNLGDKGASCVAWWYQWSCAGASGADSPSVLRDWCRCCHRQCVYQTRVRMLAISQWVSISQFSLVSYYYLIVIFQDVYMVLHCLNLAGECCDNNRRWPRVYSGIIVPCDLFIFLYFSPPVLATNQSFIGSATNQSKGLGGFNLYLFYC